MAATWPGGADDETILAQPSARRPLVPAALPRPVAVSSWSSDVPAAGLLVTAGVLVLPTAVGTPA